MRSRHILGMIALALVVFFVVHPNIVSARSDIVRLGLALTPQEQAARVWGLASPEIARKLYPSAVQTIKPFRRMPYYQHDFRRKWLEGPLDDRISRRGKLAEQIGEEGRARFAAEQGWIKLLGSKNRGVRQGPDAVYFDPRSGRLIALESKGGTSRPRWSSTFNSWQGTNQYTVRSAKYILTTFRNAATRDMKIKMAQVILAAEKGQLDTAVVRTEHVLGNPKSPELDSQTSTNVAREARRVRRDIIRTYPEAKGYFQEAGRDHSQYRKAFRADHRPLRLKYRASQGLTVVGFAGTLGLGWDAYQQSWAAWSMFDDPALKGSILPYMQTGTAFGRMAQATSLGIGSTAQLGILKLPATGVVRAAGRAFLPITLGVEGLRLATAYHAYGLGRISQREFYQRSAGPAIMAVFTVGGATVGGTIGLQAGVVGVVPGAMAGAKIGAFAAIPFQFAGDYMVNWYYREFDEQQLRSVYTAVEAYYGLEAHNEVVQH